MTENEIASIVVDIAYKIHTTIRPGLLESADEAIFAYELRKRGLQVQRQVSVPIVYEEVNLNEGFRADLIVENLVIIELKAIEHVVPVHKKQLLTYLKLTGKKLGLLINFNEDKIKDGISRVVDGL